jgi:hypothetical protein
MQVGTLFNLKAFGEEESKVDAEKQAQDMKEQALRREI